jgi:hypothetical protein
MIFLSSIPIDMLYHIGVRAGFVSPMATPQRFAGFSQERV